MKGKYAAITLALLTIMEAHSAKHAPRLVVGITIDQLRADYLEAFSQLYGQNGFRRLMAQGYVFEAASYPFEPVDLSSASATLSTGAAPFYHGIVGDSWIDRQTLLPVGSVESQGGSTAAHMKTSTIGDEMKVASNGQSIVYGVAASKEAAVLSAGHAADAAIWMDNGTGRWRTSPYYGPKQPEWIAAYSSLSPARAEEGEATNDEVAGLALQAVRSAAMGKDEYPDLLCITLSAKVGGSGSRSAWHAQAESTYMQLDNTIGRIVDGVLAEVGADNALFVVTSTGHADETEGDLSKYRVPTGTFYINRTANLLNIYLGSIYGQGRYVDACIGNEMYLDHKLIEQKRIGISEIQARAQELLVQSAGVADVFTTERLMSGGQGTGLLRNGFNVSVSGDIIIRVSPGWKLLNEDTGETFTSRAAYMPFPIIFYGVGVQAGRNSQPATVDRIAPTIAKSIRIRAPNASNSAPLF